MNCGILRNGTTRSGAVTVTLQRGDTTVLLKPVPAGASENCGEYRHSSEVTGGQGEVGGRGGIRTPDPGVANAVLSQLSYTPFGRKLTTLLV